MTSPVDSPIALRNGFTLIEVLTVLVIIAILLAIVVGFQAGTRERASDAAAKANIRSAVPAIETFRADYGTYAGMTEAVLWSPYSRGVSGIVIVSASQDDYCVRATEGGSTWFKLRPSGQITQTACS